MLPLGHPEIISQPDHTNILPPPELFHSILPLKQNGKLAFPLCATCVEEEMDKPMLNRSALCSHTDEQRQITGTWCTPELEKTVEKGYRILHIHEVWHFEDSMHGLFENYVNTWLKIKEEASGWPKYVDNDPIKRQEHLETYRVREGINLNPTKMVKNPGMRTLAKMMLNSMWGKFGQRTNKTQVLEFDDPKKFSAFHESDRFDIRYVSVLKVKCNEIC